MFPTIPHIRGSYDNSATYSTKPIANQFRQGGVIDRAISGLNPVSHTHRINEMLVGFSKVQAVRTFLAERQGKPFYYEAFQDSSTLLVLYSCTNYSFKRISSTPDGLNEDVYNFTAEFKQVHRTIL